MWNHNNATVLFVLHRALNCVWKSTTANSFERTRMNCGNNHAGFNDSFGAPKRKYRQLYVAFLTEPLKEALKRRVLILSPSCHESLQNREGADADNPNTNVVYRNHVHEHSCHGDSH